MAKNPLVIKLKKLMVGQDLTPPKLLGKLPPGKAQKIKYWLNTAYYTEAGVLTPERAKILAEALNVGVEQLLSGSAVPPEIHQSVILDALRALGKDAESLAEIVDPEGSDVGLAAQIADYLAGSEKIPTEFLEKLCKGGNYDPALFGLPPVKKQGRPKGRNGKGSRVLPAATPPTVTGTLPLPADFVVPAGCVFEKREDGTVAILLDAKASLEMLWRLMGK